MAENNNDTVTKTDIYQQQKKTIDTLIEVLDRQGTTGQEIIYTQPPPQPKQPPNYLLYAGLAIVAILFFKK